MNRRRIAWAASALLGLLVALPASAAADEGSMHDLIVVLKERGVIGAEDYESIAAKNAAYEAEQKESRKPSLSFWGDFRARYEGFFFGEDETGVERTNRHRGRYRFRLNGKADVNPHTKVLFRFASGREDSRSSNQSFGTGNDFDTDDFRLDRAYVWLSPFAHGKVGENGTFAIEIGKVPNPYRWKKGKDWLVWDGDINPEGVSLLYTHRLSEGVETFFSGGYYVLDENSRDKDPHLWAAQVGFHAEPAETIGFGAKASYYHFDSLDMAFHQRGVAATLGVAGAATTAGGNISDGLSGGFGGQNVQVVETTAYFEALKHTDWPVLIYGTWVNNLTAERSRTFSGAPEEDTGWGGGVEIGNKKKYVKLGVGFWQLQANAFPAQFVDSNLFDGFTNREGWALYGSRTIYKNTDLNITAFLSDELDDDVPPFGNSVPNAERLRLQADLVVKFK